jgi:hypothetical protein
VTFNLVSPFTVHSYFDGPRTDLASHSDYNVPTGPGNALAPDGQRARRSSRPSPIGLRGIGGGRLSPLAFGDPGLMDQSVSLSTALPEATSVRSLHETQWISSCDVVRFTDPGPFSTWHCSLAQLRPGEVSTLVISFSMIRRW